MRRNFHAIALAAVLALPGGLSAQKNIPTALVGGAAGAASGGYIAISVIVAESRAGEYMHSYADALGWRSAPVLIGGLTGTALGLYDPDRLWRTMLYGTVGTVGGLGAGVALGQVLWDGPEAKWAGGAIGAGLGMAIGSSLGLLLPLKDKDEDNNVPAALRAERSVRVPVFFTIRF